MDLCGIIPGQNCHWSPFFSGCSLVWVPVRHRILSLSRLLHCRSYCALPSSCTAPETCKHLRKVHQQCTAAPSTPREIAQSAQAVWTVTHFCWASQGTAILGLQMCMLGRALAYLVASRHHVGWLRATCEVTERQNRSAAQGLAVGARAGNSESARLSSGATSLEARAATVVQGASRAYRTSEMSERPLNPCAHQPDLSCEKHKDRTSTHLAGGRDQVQRNWLNLFAANSQH